MTRFYLLAASWLVAASGAHAQSTITNLQASNITATTATITFNGSHGSGPFASCGTLIKYAIAGGALRSVSYAMPLRLTGLPPAGVVTVQVIPRVDNPFAAGAPCVLRPEATVTFTTAATPLAAASAAEAGSLTLAPNPARTRATLTLAAPLPAPATAQVFDALGQELRQLPLPARATTAALDLAGLAPGFYLVRVGAATARLVVE